MANTNSKNKKKKKKKLRTLIFGTIVPAIIVFVLILFIFKQVSDILHAKRSDNVTVGTSVAEQTTLIALNTGLTTAPEGVEISVVSTYYDATDRLFTMILYLDGTNSQANLKDFTQYSTDGGSSDVYRNYIANENNTAYAFMVCSVNDVESIPDYSFTYIYDGQDYSYSLRNFTLDATNQYQLSSEYRFKYNGKVSKGDVLHYDDSNYLILGFDIDSVISQNYSDNYNRRNMYLFANVVPLTAQDFHSMYSQIKSTSDTTLEDYVNFTDNYSIAFNGTMLTSEPESLSGTTGENLYVNDVYHEVNSSSMCINLGLFIEQVSKDTIPELNSLTGGIFDIVMDTNYGQHISITIE